MILAIPVVVLAARQSSPAPRLEITGVNASEMPTVIVTANVYDTLGQPVRGLTAADFSLAGDLAGQAQITNVENITDDNLPFATVLLIDTSSSMIGTPIENARLAAHAFIDNIGENDPVAIMVFDTQVVLVQDYTTDKAALHAVIDGVRAGGETALYQAAYDAIVHAALSPTPRRAVILLSDGAEYGERSTVGREAAAAEALVRGVPVYTIGLGFGADRTYLQELASGTNARTYDLPTPEQLTQIYTDLAALLRSQYVITLDAPLPLDGTQYNLRLSVNTPEGAADATAVLRAPIPVPIVRLPRYDAPFSEPTDVLATVLADDPLTSITYDLDGNDPQTLSVTPYVIHIDPVDLLPGIHVLTVTATDDDGDQGSDVIALTIAALPSEISLSPDPASLGAISQPQTITVQTSGQTPATAISITFNDSDTPTELSEPYSFTIDPMQFPPGDNSVTVRVTNAGGVTAAQTFDFTVAALPPQITVVGLQDGQSIDATVSFSLDITTQEELAAINASVNGAAIEPNADGSYTLDPIDFAPGANTLTVSATTAGGLTGTARVNVMVVALPPQIVVNGLEPGETLSADREVSFDFISQSPVNRVTVSVDGDAFATLTRAPFGITLRVLDFAPGAHTLSIAATNANAQSSTLDLPFTIAPEPAFTATATALIATQAAQSTATQQAAMTASAVLATQSAREANATGTQVANASETAAAAMATQVAQATLVAQATATEIANASETAAAAMATQQAQATLIAQATATQVANASSTVAAQATQQAQSVNATATAAQATAVAIEQATLDVQATQNAQATATEAVIQAVQVAQATATAEARLTITTEAQATQTAVAAAATATDAARATELASNLATLNANITATAEARLTTTTEAEATQTANAANATATDVARATELASNLATLNANITATAERVQATSTQQALLAGTGDARATEQAITDATGTAVVQATAEGLATQAAADEQSTQSAEATQSALDATATQNTRATATQAAQATQDTLATRAAVVVAETQAATRDALATANAQARLVAQETQAARATRDANATLTQEANATATAVQETQDAADATATQTARDATVEAEQTLNALEATATQFIINATATRHALETRSADAALATQNAQEATATIEAEITGVAQSTLDAQTTQQAQATVDRASLLTVTAEQLANLATGTADANATANANILATEVQSTQVAQALATTDAQATIDTRLTAIGPTATPLGGGEEGAPTGTPPPSPTLTEIQAEEPPASSNVAPILIVLIVIIVVIIVLVLVMRGRGTPPPRR